MGIFPLEELQFWCPDLHVVELFREIAIQVTSNGGMPFSSLPWMKWGGNHEKNRKEEAWDSSNESFERLFYFLRSPWGRPVWQIKRKWWFNLLDVEYCRAVCFSDPGRCTKIEAGGGKKDRKEIIGSPVPPASNLKVGSWAFPHQSFHATKIGGQVFFKIPWRNFRFF